MMKTLSNREILRLNNAIGDLYSLGTTDNYHRKVMSIVRQVLAFDRSSYNKLDSQVYKNLIHGTEEEQVSADSLKNVLQMYVLEHPFWKFKKGVKTISEMTEERQFRKTSLYNEYYRKLGTDSQLLCGLPAPTGRLELYAFSRGAKDFSDREKLILSLLKPHLTNSARNAIEICRFKDEIALLRVATDAEERGTILLTNEGRIDWISRRARHWLAEYFGAPLRGRDTLPQRLAKWAMGEMTAPVLTTERVPLTIGYPVPLPKAAQKKLVINFIADMGRYGSDPVHAENSGFMLIMTEETAPVPETFGLTPREAEVLYWVAEGKANGCIAIILGVSVRTVEKHMERIFEKLGVETRVAAAAMLLEK